MNEETNAPRSITGIYPHSCTIGPALVGKTTPDSYRLARKQNGDLILQGAYTWTFRGTDDGHEWRDIPTVELTGE